MVHNRFQQRCDAPRLVHVLFSLDTATKIPKDGASVFERGHAHLVCRFIRVVVDDVDGIDHLLRSRTRSDLVSHHTIFTHCISEELQRSTLHLKVLVVAIKGGEDSSHSAAGDESCLHRLEIRKSQHFQLVHAVG